MKSEQKMLFSNLAACAQRIEKLRFSVNKNHPLFPLELETIGKLTDEQEESIDALILRYSQCVSMIQDQIFRGIAYAEQEDLADKSNRDKTLLMEKLGVIRSADEFGTAAILRNKFSHHYPEEAQGRLDRLNLVLEESKFVLNAFADIQAFLRKKGFLGTN
jgi:hypothetical protein